MANWANEAWTEKSSTKSKGNVSSANATESEAPEKMQADFGFTPVEPQETQQITAPVVEDVGRINGAHYSPQWFLDEQANRKNPQYETEIPDFTNEFVDASANYIRAMQAEHPEEWENGEVGWREDSPIWEKVAPYEEEYQKSAQSQTQAAQEELNANLDQIMNGQTPAQTAPATMETGPDNREANFLALHPEYEKIVHPDASGADYENLKTSGKVDFLLFPALAGTDIENAPEQAKAVQPLLTSALSSTGIGSAVKTVGTVLGVKGTNKYAVASSALLFAYNYAKGLNLIKGNEKVDELVENLDFLDTVGQEFQGKIVYNMYRTRGIDVSDPADFAKNVGYIITHLRELTNDQSLHDEYADAVIDVVLHNTANMGASLGIADLVSRTESNIQTAMLNGDENWQPMNRGETTRHNQGLEGTFQIDEYGAHGQKYWLDLGQELYKAGYTNPVELEQKMLQYMGGYYGDLFNKSEIFEHEIGDFANLVEGQQARAINIYANATGDVNLAKASKAHVGNIFADLTDNIPLVGDMIRAVARATGHEQTFRTSGGIDEVLATWDMENKASPVSQLTARDRRFSGISADNKISDFTPNKSTSDAKNIFEKVKIAVENFFGYTNEYRAVYEGSTIFDFISTGIEDAIRAREEYEVDPATGEKKLKDNTDTTIARVRQFINELENPELIPEDSPMYDNSQSALFNSVKDDLAIAIKNNRAKIDRSIKRFGDNAQSRQALNALSKALNMTPSKILDMYENKKTVLTQMIIDKADANGGKIEGIDIPVESRDFGVQVIGMLKPFTGENKQAWDVRQLTVELTSDIADGVSDAIVNKYQIQPDKFIYRFGDMVKKMQNLVLLGLSPSYLANNFVNNVVTRTSLGYGGYMTEGYINEWMDRFGFTPERLTESVGENIGQTQGGDSKQSNYAKLNARINAERQKTDGKGIRKDINNAMKKVGDAGQWASSTFGIFGKASNWVERNESKQIVASSMMTYMARTWKAGVNFRKMPVSLERKIRSQNPAMVDALYAGISKGMNMAEIEDAIFGTYIAPSVQDTLLESAKRCNFEKPEDIVSEYFVKGGMLARLESALKGKRGNEIDGIVNDFAEYLKKMMSLQLSGDIATRANIVAQATGLSGFTEALDVASRMSNDMMEIWLNSQDANTNLFHKRLEENIAPDKFHKMYQDHLKNLNERWQGVYETAKQDYDGILKGLGFDTDQKTKFLKALNNKSGIWSKFYNETQPNLFKPYLEAISYIHTDNDASWKARREEAWAVYQAKITAEYDDAVANEMAEQMKMDEAFIEGLKKPLGTVHSAEIDAVIAPMQEAIRKKRLEIVEQNKKIREVADNIRDLNRKNTAWDEAQQRKYELKNEYRKLQQDMYDAIKPFARQLTETQDNTPPSQVDHEANIQNQELTAEAEKTAKTAQEFNEKMSEGDVEKNLKDVEDTTPKGWSMELTKKSAYDIAKKMGATNTIAWAFKNIVRAIANNFERNFPNKKFYDEVKMRVEYLDEDHYVNVSDANGSLYQIETVDEGNLNRGDDNFSAWAMNEDNGYYPKFLWAFEGDELQSKTLPSISQESIDKGEVIKWYHGSSEEFDSFNLNKAGRTGLSEGMGIYLTPHKDIADRYHANHQGKKGHTYELVTNVSKPLDTSPDTEVNFDVVSAMADIIMNTLTQEELENLKSERYLSGNDSLFGTYYGFYNQNEYGIYPFYTRYQGDELIRKSLIDYLSGGYQGSNSSAIDAYCSIMSGDYKYGGDKMMLASDEVTPEILKGIGDKRLDALRKLHNATGYDSTYSFSEGGKHHWVGDGDMILVVWFPENVKAVTNEGEWSRENSNIYHQENGEHRIKGEFTVEKCERIAKMYRGSDISTLVHETLGHGFISTLNETQLEALSAYNGWTVDRYRQLENQWNYHPELMSKEDRQAWLDSQEKFAYGFEQYLLEGKAPNSKMRVVFETFRKYLLDIYRGLKHLIYNGEEIDINKSQNNITLGAIFDSMLGEDTQLQSQLQHMRQNNAQSLQDATSNSYQFVTTELADGTPVGPEFHISDEAKEFFKSDLQKKQEQIDKIKQASEDKMRSDVAEYVAGASERWNLIDIESEELIVEMMHQLGLNLDIPEDEQVKRTLFNKMTKIERNNIKKFISDHRETASNISDKAIDAMLDDIEFGGNEDADESFGYSFGAFQTDENQQKAFEARKQKAEEYLKNGKYVPIEYIDLTTLEPSGTLEKFADDTAQKLYDLEQKDDDIKTKHTVEQFRSYVYASENPDGTPSLSDTDVKGIDTFVQFADKDGTLKTDIQAIRRRQKYADNIRRGNRVLVAQTFSFTFGQHEIVGVVAKDGRKVAYVPRKMPLLRTETLSGRELRVLGVSPTDPTVLVYLDGDEVKTEKKPEPKQNPVAQEMDKDDVPVVSDPVPQAHNQMGFDQILPILNDFVELYKRNLNNAMTNNRYSSLDEDTRKQIREYVDKDIRQDLMNTKYKTAKFGELMRDSALLNYSKRYGFDNFLTLLCPYQFWNTRSFAKWLSRTSSKGGKMWRRYARLKKLEEANKKEFMPSRISGMFGMYVPFLPDWMGDKIFMSPEQLLVAPSFMSPLEDNLTTNNAILASAERYLQEMLDENDITREEYLTAMNPDTRGDSSAWAEAYAKAKMTESSDNSFSSLAKQYLALSLPLSIANALQTGEPKDWNQWPMTRLGTAWRGAWGDNIVGRIGQGVLSAPERLLRDTIGKKYGSQFEYNEFGSFGDYYIRNQVWDMVIEGKISSEEAMQACAEKDGNKIWDEAGDRQRQEVLTKIQGGLAVESIKNMAKDVAEGNSDKYLDDFFSILTSVATAPFSKQIVRDAEEERRELHAQIDETYENDDKELREQIYTEHPEMTFDNIRYESDPEQAYRKYLYKSIMNDYYDLDRASQEQVEMSFGDDFRNYVLNKETRAIESMDLDTLAGYAQALNGKVPFLATDDLNTVGPKAIIMDTPEEEKTAYNTYYEEREKLWAGWAEVNNIYYSLPAEQREAFLKATPQLADYQKWNDDYKKAHSDADNFLKRRTDYYNIRDCERVCALLDPTTMKVIRNASWADKSVDKEWQPIIKRAMREAGVTKDYDYFEKLLKGYVLGQ